MNQALKLSRQVFIGLLAVWLAIPSARAQKAGDVLDAQARYKQDMQECALMTSADEVATCRLEARNALAEIKRGRIDEASEEQYRQNALRRCEAHPVDERDDCIARMQGLGHTEGSVSGGGILREIETVVPGPSPQE